VSDFYPLKGAAMIDVLDEMRRRALAALIPPVERPLSESIGRPPINLPDRPTSRPVRFYSHQGDLLKAEYRLNELE
jgi:hypothetical protein